MKNILLLFVLFNISVSYAQTTVYLYTPKGAQIIGTVDSSDYNAAYILHIYDGVNDKPEVLQIIVEH